MGLVTNLFSVFDPSSGSNLSLNWKALVLGLIAVPMSKWVSVARWGAFIPCFCASLVSEMAALMPSKSQSAVLFMLILLFNIFALNSAGLLPYLFTPTSHLVVSMSLALPLWVGAVAKGWGRETKSMLVHLVPMGTPALLLPFMVVVESVSSVIRPVTLAVRLTANMIAGHLLLVLMSSAAGWGLATSVGVLTAQVALVLLEMAVAIIQAYVFMTLSTLYVSEV